MKPHENFYTLGEVERIDLVWKGGKLIGQRIYGDSTLVLYRVVDYCGEITDSNTLNTIQGFNAFSNLGRLIPYGDNLNLPE